MIQKNTWTSIKTSIGLCGIAWEDKSITRFILPVGSKKELQKIFGIKESPAPAWVQRIINKVVLHLQGTPQNFSSVPLKINHLPPFHQKVYLESLKLKSGELSTYGEMAKRVKSPQASRAVGQALGKNPIALIIPCHRVTASGGKPGGFSAHGGLKTKSKMLEIEGVELEANLEILSSPLKISQAIKDLKKIDHKIEAIIKKVGPLDYEAKTKQSPYHSLFRSIIFQQLNGAAASTILERVKKIFKHQNIPTPQELLSTPDKALWSAGLSKAKAKYLKALAQASLDGLVPSTQQIKKMSNQEIIKQLTTIHGVGQWTVEMFLIFTLGRADVLPTGDFAIRKSMGKIFNLKEMPTPKEAQALGEQWKPYRSVASLYLWRFLDQ